MRRLFIFLLSAVLVCGAQSETRKLTGTVEDVKGWKVSHATFRMMRAGKTKVVYRGISNSNGAFTAFGLEPGTYDICFESPGYERLCKTSISVEASVMDLGRVRLRLESQGGIAIETVAPQP